MIKKLLSRFEGSKSSRNTDLDWQIIGEKDPYFGVLTAEKFKRGNLNKEAITEFFQFGENDICYFVSRMREIFGLFEPHSALDFGCGVGRLTVPLAALTGSAIGVDISPGMLAEASKHRHPGLRFVDAIPEEQFDWVVSIIVLQHIPPQRGYAIIKQLLDRVAAGGGITLQIMFGRTAKHEKARGSRLIIDESGVRPSAAGPIMRKPLLEGQMLMHDYDLSHVVGLFYSANMKGLFLEHCDHGGIIGTTIYGKKPGQ